MSKRKYQRQQINRYRTLAILSSWASLIVLIIFLGLTFLFYLTAFRQVVTLSHLFLLLFMLLGAVFLQMHAWHYQKMMTYFNPTTRHAGQRTRVKEGEYER